MGIDVCFIATSAPPQSRNHTLYSSSKTCKHVKDSMNYRLFPRSIKLLETLLKSVTYARTTCLQELPPSEEINMPISVDDSSGPTLPEIWTDYIHIYLYINIFFLCTLMINCQKSTIKQVTGLCVKTSENKGKWGNKELNYMVQLICIYSHTHSVVRIQNVKEVVSWDIYL